MRRKEILVLALLFLITIPMLTKVFTSDFGTHLAIGREIIQDRSVTDKEFLNYPSLGRHNPNGEWGFQAVLYLVYAAGGVYGVSLLCWAVVFSIFLLLHRSMALRGGDPWLAVLAIFAFSGFLRIRIQPRPEIFTYLFIALTIFLLAEYYFGKRKKLLYLFPAVILVWANMHPTYLMAFLLCGAFFVDGLARAAWRREFRWGHLRTWVFPPVAVGIAGLLLCGLNPHGYEAILIPLHVISRGGSGGGSSILMSISELTPVKGTGFYGYYQAAAIIAGGSLLLGIFGRRIYLLDLFLFSIAFKGAWDSARAVSMMGLFLSPGISLHLTGFVARTAEWFAPKAQPKGKPSPEKGKNRGKKSKPAGKGDVPVSPTRFLGRQVALVVVLVTALAAFGGTMLSFSFSQLQYGIGMTEHKFSFAAAEFLRKNPVPGKMFNFFDVGGFLDWQLYPQALTFIDGRTYNDLVFQEHQVVTGAMPGWENILEKYGVTYVVTKTIDSSGAILPFLSPLTYANDWSLVFADGLFVVFVRHTPGTMEYIRKHQIQKNSIFQHIALESHHYIYLGVSPVLAYQTMSRMYEMMGDRAAAIQALRSALEYQDLPFLRSQLMRLEGRTGTPR
ncbi:MAG TPA: hypothetical protein DD658_08830 [Deltaproteobacteria bacterium]|nr:MAG: hypothetical protein A2X88_04085 [Deltaproteobacteria bacterium GWC2_65_14]HBO70212.1 hypothetical protein [Deltaproteobacteria bacterium]